MALDKAVLANVQAQLVSVDGVKEQRQQTQYNSDYY